MYGYLGGEPTEITEGTAAAVTTSTQTDNATDTFRDDSAVRPDDGQVVLTAAVTVLGGRG